MKRRLVDDAGQIALRSHSMIGFYLTGLCLIIPAVLQYGLGIESNPNLWYWAAVVSWVYGMVGRVVRQNGLGG